MKKWSSVQDYNFQAVRISLVYSCTTPVEMKTPRKRATRKFLEASSQGNKNELKESNDSKKSKKSAGIEEEINNSFEQVIDI